MTSAETIAAMAQTMAEAHGLDLHAIAAELTNRADDERTGKRPSAGPAGMTLGEYLPIVEAATRGKLTATQRTYRTYWRFLADGIHLRSLGGRNGQRRWRAWNDERVAEWLAHADTINTERDFGFELPDELDDYQRDEHGAVIVWPGYGHLPMRDIGATRFLTATNWQMLFTLTTAALRDEKRLEDERGPCGWTGHGAVETLITATRYLYKLAAGDDVVPQDFSPAKGADKPPRVGPGRGLLSNEQVEDVIYTMSATGDDPELDGLLARYHLLTGARQEGAWRLELQHLDDERLAIRVPDKNSPTKHGGDDIDDLMPVTAEFLAELRAFAASRGSVAPRDPVFRLNRRCRTTGEPHPRLTRRRYNTIYKRIRDQHAWARQREVGVHWLRGYSAARIEEIAGRPAKMRFLRHRPNGQTDGYGPAGYEHLCWAFAQWTGRPHPKATRPSYLG